MNPGEIAEEAIGRLNKKITDEIFLIIQNDPRLMHEYLRAVEISGLDTVNKTIGKKVKTRYKLSNMNDRENRPSCTLIRSHQIFE